MTTAKDTLQELSSDPVAQRLARERETAVLMHRHLVNSSREVGRAEGRAEGEAKAVLSVLEARGITVTDQQRQQILECTDLDRLNGWIRLDLSPVSCLVGWWDVAHVAVQLRSAGRR